MSKLAALRKLAQDWKGQPRDERGRWAREKAVGFARENPGRVKDIIVNSGGVAGSIAGGAIAGPAGKLAGDLVGAMATRKAVQDIEATYSAHQRLKKDKAFQAAGKLEKLKRLRAEAVRELEEKRQKGEIEKENAEDTLGWAIGNASAEAIGRSVEALSGIPLKGAVVAMATVPKLTPKALALKQRLAKNYGRR